MRPRGSDTSDLSKASCGTRYPNELLGAFLSGDTIHPSKANAIGNVNENEQSDNALPARECGDTENECKDRSNHRDQNQHASNVPRAENELGSHINDQDKGDSRPDNTGPFGNLSKGSSAHW